MGAASRDIDPTDPRGWRLGGGVTYSAMALARLGIRVAALIGLDGAASSARELAELHRAGVELLPVALVRGPVFDNQETARGRVQLCRSASDRLPTSALPERWRSAASYLLNPVAGELGDEWASGVPHDALVALGWQGLFRRLEPGRPVEALPLAAGPLLARADLATVSTEDAAGGAGEALARLLPRSGQQLVVTSDRGMSLLLRRDGAGWRARSLPVRPAAVVRDPTGAGDVFLASWLAGVLASRRAGAADPWRPLALAAAAAGLKVETASLGRMADLRAIAQRLVKPPELAPPSG